jgi:hypothetical protein
MASLVPSTKSNSFIGFEIELVTVVCTGLAVIACLRTPARGRLSIRTCWILRGGPMRRWLDASRRRMVEAVHALWAASPTAFGAGA